MVVVSFLAVVFGRVELKGWANVMKCSALEGESGGVGLFLL